MKTLSESQRERLAAGGRKGGRGRWSPESRAAEAIRVLVAQAPELSEDQKDTLRALLAGPSKAAGAR